MTVRTTFLLLSLVAIALSAPVSPVSSKAHANITLHTPLLVNFTWNVANNVTVTITHAVPVVVCVVGAKYGPPNETQYSENVCTVFNNFTVPDNHMSTFSFPALMYTYIVGVYFDHPEEINKGNWSTITVEVTADECHPDSFWVNEKDGCVNATAFKGTGNETLKEDFMAKETKFFTWNNPERVPALTFKLLDNTDNGQPEDFLVYARYMGNPVGQPPADHNGTLIIDLPLPGTWVFAVYRSADTDGAATLSVAGDSCAVGHAGPGCPEITVAKSNVTLTLTAKTGHTPTYTYYFNASKTAPLWVSVTTFNQSFIPMLYASQGQLPAIDGSNAMISNCNRDYCSAVHSIFYNTTADMEDWYITVHTVLESGNITFGIWFGENCVTDCTKNNRGQCLPDGTCQCYLDFTGIDCAISEGLGAPYIVLIIIASLVVASAVVGFVAWAYMRRKRNDYETLS